MATIQHIITDDLITWDHGAGICKLIRVPREEIDEGSDDPDAWDLLWIEASTNVRRTDIRLDTAAGRDDGITDDQRDQVVEYMETAPDEARAVLRPYTLVCPRFCTTVDQHDYDHVPTGLPVMHLTDITTGYHDIYDIPWSEMDADSREDAIRAVREYHEARVELASLRSDHRGRAVEWLARQPLCDPDQCAAVTREAIEETREIA
jgi:hypothetical protein